VGIPGLCTHSQTVHPEAPTRHHDGAVQSQERHRAAHSRRRAVELTEPDESPTDDRFRYRLDPDILDAGAEAGEEAPAPPGRPTVLMAALMFLSACTTHSGSTPEATPAPEAAVEVAHDWLLAINARSTDITESMMMPEAQAAWSGSTTEWPTFTQIHCGPLSEVAVNQKDVQCNFQMTVLPGQQPDGFWMITERLMKGHWLVSNWGTG
jgi:hypothetical protein